MQSIYHEETLPLTQTALFLELQPCGILFLMNAFLPNTIWILLKKMLTTFFSPWHCIVFLFNFFLSSSSSSPCSGTTCLEGSEVIKKRQMYVESQKHFLKWTFFVDVYNFSKLYDTLKKSHFLKKLSQKRQCNDFEVLKWLSYVFLNIIYQNIFSRT